MQTEHDKEVAEYALPVKCIINTNTINYNIFFIKVSFFPNREDGTEKDGSSQVKVYFYSTFKNNRVAPKCCTTNTIQQKQ